MPWSPMRKVSMLNGTSGTRGRSPSLVAVLYMQAAARSGSVQPGCRPRFVPPEEDGGIGEKVLSRVVHDPHDAARWVRGP